MAWRRPGDKLLSEPMMVRLPTHIYGHLASMSWHIMLAPYGFINPNSNGTASYQAGQVMHSLPNAVGNALATVLENA